MTLLPQLPESAWFKSSHSQGSGASCVEVAFAPESWFKSSHSQGSGANCVEIADGGGAVGIRDTKRRDAGHLAVPAAAFAAFVAAARAGDLTCRR